MLLNNGIWLLDTLHLSIEVVESLFGVLFIAIAVISLPIIFESSLRNKVKDVVTVAVGTSAGINIIEKVGEYIKGVSNSGNSGDSNAGGSNSGSNGGGSNSGTNSGGSNSGANSGSNTGSEGSNTGSNSEGSNTGGGEGK